MEHDDKSTLVVIFDSRDTMGSDFGVYLVQVLDLGLHYIANTVYCASYCSIKICFRFQRHQVWVLDFDSIGFGFG